MATPLRSRSTHRLTSAFAVAALLLGLTACSGSESASQDAVPAAPMTELAPQGTPNAPQSPTVPDEQRDVVKTASLTLAVDDAGDAADRAVELAEAARGRVDNRSESGGSESGPTRVSLRLQVPAAELDAVITELRGLGTVHNLKISSEDVTQQRVDLDARITALQTSVDRLLAIMRDARDPEALIQAEDALAERQADLDSLRAQRTALGNRIEYSSIDVEVTSTRVASPAAHRGFLGQLQRGWETLVSAANYAMLTFGLLLPWLAALAVAGGLLYLLVRALTRRSRPQPPAARPANAPSARPPAAVSTSPSSPAPAAAPADDGEETAK